MHAIQRSQPREEEKAAARVAARMAVETEKSGGVAKTEGEGTDDGVDGVNGVDGAYMTYDQDGYDTGGDYDGDSADDGEADDPLYYNALHDGIGGGDFDDGGDDFDIGGAGDNEYYVAVHDDYGGFAENATDYETETYGFTDDGEGGGKAGGGTAGSGESKAGSAGKEGAADGGSKEGDNATWPGDTEDGSYNYTDPAYDIVRDGKGKEAGDSKEEGGGKEPVATSEVPVATPDVSVATPAVSVATPTESVATPAESVATPEVKIATPAESVATPEVQVATPAESVATTAEPVATPTESVATPEVKVATPEVSVATPEVKVATSEVSVATSEVSVATPEVSVATTAEPVATTAEPVATPEVATPAESVATPVVSVATPEDKGGKGGKESDDAKDGDDGPYLLYDALEASLDVNVSGQTAANSSAVADTPSAASSGPSTVEVASVKGVAEGYHHEYAFAQVAAMQQGGRSVEQVWEEYTPHAKHDAIVKASPDVFKALPEFFSSRTKNPCWFQNKTLRCIPYYHIIGVSKCGTTDIYNRLVKHPHIYESLNKGPHWWDECPWPLKGACTAPPNGDFEGYIDLFAEAAKKIQHDTAGITGEASSNTFTSARGVFYRGPRMTEDMDVNIAQLMREASPFLRLIMIFRNPVERYYSAFYYYRWWKKDEPEPTPEDFHTEAERDVATWNTCVEKSGVPHCVKRYNPQQLVKGRYSEFRGKWLDVLPIQAPFSQIELQIMRLNWGR
ncbi:hypothetical protein FOA52_010358 [Chlamydomonas sp. UWO 241]|nr:hypothetical protein FOA52_010358 [Chlamydomonas sp. UWO 241]